VMWEGTKLSSIGRMLACARPQGAKRPTPTQLTCLYYCHGNEASKCVYWDFHWDFSLGLFTGTFHWDFYRAINNVY
jgi:hypothetical protein